jgi:hypothetical protein
VKGVTDSLDARRSGDELAFSSSALSDRVARIKGILERRDLEGASIERGSEREVIDLQMILHRAPALTPSAYRELCRRIDALENIVK